MNLTKQLFTLYLIGMIILSPGLFASSASTSNIISMEENAFEQPYSTIKFKSHILNEERELKVHLPENYKESDKKYPVLYLLDGNRHLAHAIIAEDTLQAQSLIPQHIIVAITNNRGTRRRDLSSGKTNFLNFIKSEVFDLIANRYRTTERKTLFRHSMAGAFAMDILATQPDKFSNYITASPVIQLNNSELIEKFEVLKLADDGGNKSLYLTLGNQSAEGKNAADAFKHFLDLLRSQSIKNLISHHQYLRNQVHMTTPNLTLYSGLTFAFADYHPPVYEGYDNFKKNGKINGLDKYYADRAKKYSVSAIVPERTIRNFGFAIFDDGHQSEGIKILEENVRKYPNSLRALNALAQLLEEAKDIDKAIKICEKAVDLAKNQSSRNLNHFEAEVKRLKKLK